MFVPEKKNDWNYIYSLNWLLEHPRWLKATNEQIADMWITKQIKIDHIFNLLKQKMVGITLILVIG